VNLAAIPWDFWLILTLLGTLVPWRGAVRIKRLLSRDLQVGERLSLYISTIAYQWFMVAIVAWRAFSRNLSSTELGLTVGDTWRTAWSTVALTALLCANQIVSLRVMARVHDAKRTFLFQLREKIMPTTRLESIVFVALACTAGSAEEFLYRGFVLVVFRHLFLNVAYAVGIAAVVSSMWFAIGHLYQGIRGVITTFVVGILFVSVRIWSGSLLPPIIAHAGIDLIAGIYGSRVGKADESHVEG